MDGHQVPKEEEDALIGTGAIVRARETGVDQTEDPGAGVFHVKDVDIQDQSPSPIQEATLHVPKNLEREKANLLVETRAREVRKDADQTQNPQEDVKPIRAVLSATIQEVTVVIKERA